MQLVAYGAQDVYLTAEPTITFWKAVYRRHTNFAMESMEQTLNGSANWGNKVVCRVSRNGDLMGRTYVRATLPALSPSDQWCNQVGFRLLKQVELRVGGQMIDRHYSTWMHIWSELTHTTDQKALLEKLVGPTMTDGAAQTGYADSSSVVLNIPLLFAFCRHPGLALPLIALQYHEVEIQIEFESLNNSTSDGANPATGVTSLTNVSLWVDYIFLDTEERKEFAQKPHEYLIETVQTQESSAVNGANSVRLTFNHPTKFITWVVRDSTVRDVFTDYNKSGAVGTSTVTDAKLKLNGQDRFATRTSDYFNYVQPYQHFTGKPDLGINVYSFALKPEEHQPSGSCNLSRIDNVNLDFTGNLYGAGTLSVYAFSYNVFRVASGMGGLAYSN